MKEASRIGMTGRREGPESEAIVYQAEAKSLKVKKPAQQQGQREA